MLAVACLIRGEATTFFGVGARAITKQLGTKIGYSSRLDRFTGHDTIYGGLMALGWRLEGIDPPKTRQEKSEF
jgi:hypothetical protein